MLLPWNAVLTTFDFFGKEVENYTTDHTWAVPATVYPFGVNGLASVTQIVVLING